MRVKNTGLMTTIESPCCVCLLNLARNNIVLINARLAI